MTTFGAEFGLLVKRRRALRGLSQDQLANLLWAELKGPKDHPRKPDISRLETGRVANPQERTVLLICEKLGISEHEVNVLRRAPPPDPYGLSSVYDTFRAKSREDLYRVAESFGMDAPQDQSDAKLIAFLQDKAKDIESLRREVEALPGRSERVDNILGAALAAIGAGNLGEARTLLDSAREMQRELLRKPLETNAALIEATASIYLIEGKAEAAFAALSAAADSTAAIDRIDGARRRRAYGDLLSGHGLRYGGAGLPLAIRLFDRALQDLTRDDDAWLFAAFLNSRALALQAQGSRTAGPDGAAFLSRAVADYTLALSIRTRAEHPVDWAGTLQNRANALSQQGSRRAGPEGAALLSRAVDDYTQALSVFTRAEHPVDWAMTRANMALQEQARAGHDSRADPRPHLRAALDHVEAALEVFDPDHTPFYHGTATALRDDLRAALAALAP